jgi:hypothetical protein
MRDPMFWCLIVINVCTAASLRRDAIELRDCGHQYWAGAPDERPRAAGRPWDDGEVTSPLRRTRRRDQEERALETHGSNQN